MSEPSPSWLTYEQVAARILHDLREAFGLDRVEGKQAVPGLQSGTEWVLDAKGVRADRDAFIIIECRRYTTNRIKQEDAGALAYRIQDTGADGALLVSPLGLQEGARKVAQASRVIEVRLPADATPEQFGLEFLGNVIVRVRGVEAESAVGQVTVTSDTRVLETE